MPEGPEIKIITDYLSETLENKVIYDIQFCSGQYLEEYPEGYTDIEKYFPLLIEGVYCKGNLIYFSLFNETKRFYILHTIRLNGFWDTELKKDIRWYFLLDNDEKFYFYDSSCLCTLKFVDNEEILKENLESLGPDILSEDFSLTYWKAKVNDNKNKNVTCFLMDQTLFSGIGNIIKSEALFYAKISPNRKVGTLTENESEKLFEGIRIVSRFSYIVGDIETNLQIYGKKNAQKLKTPDGRITHWDEKIQV